MNQGVTSTPITRPSWMRKPTAFTPSEPFTKGTPFIFAAWISRNTASNRPVAW